MADYVFYEQTDSGVAEIARLAGGVFSGVKAEKIEKNLRRRGWQEGQGVGMYFALSSRISAVPLAEAEELVAPKENPGPGYSRESGHRGRKGMERGGSLPALKPKVRRQTADRTTEAKREKGTGGTERLLKRLTDRIEKTAKEYEPVNTEMMKELAEATGGQLRDLDYRLKRRDSITRKIQSTADWEKVSLEEAAEMITDANRYTLILEADDLVAGVKAAEAEFAKRNLKRYDHKYMNYFGRSKETAYEGYNTVWWDETTGNRFELQFHTPESLEIKQKAHGLYEEWRVMSGETTKKKNLWDSMVDLWSGYKRPPNYQMLESAK